MRTYQDLVEIREKNDQKKLNEFILDVIGEHKNSELYKVAFNADQYYRHLNPTIMKAQKIVYDLMGRAVEDIWSANNKIPCRYYYYFVTQSVQFLLGNGVSFGKSKNKEKLGKTFDRKIKEAATNAINGGVSFAFWNLDHIDVFNALEFAPLYDEENGALMAGIRFWQVAPNKPLRVTLFEIDGYTEYIRKTGEELTELQEKRDYKQVHEKAEATGTKIYNGGNYEGFPIVPMFNINKQSELIGNRETIDAYDLMASALINNIDDANIIYWVIKNAGGMDDIDDEKFIQRLKTLHVAHLEGNEEVDQHSVNVPFEASETALKRLRSQLFDDFMALDVKEIASGATTATQIEAAYEPLNQKTDAFEDCVTDCIQGILALAGIDDEPTYTRSIIINQQEQIDTIVSSAQFLPSVYITRKLLEIIGDIDKVDDIIKEMTNEEATRYSNQINNQNEAEEQEENPEE